MAEIEDRIARLEDRVTKLEGRRAPEPTRKLGLNIDPKAVRASLAEKGWTQSDLAAAMFGRRRNVRGALDAVGKDLISTWLSGKSRPSAENWARLRQYVEVV